MKFIEHLLPHRAPFLMVESIVGYMGGDAPILNAEYPLRPSEPIFSGAELPLYWPSVYVIEGLSQCCSLLNLIWTCERIYAANALDTGNISAALMNVEGADGNYTLEQLLEISEGSTMNVASRIGMLASVDIEIVGQVRAGELLRYRVDQTRVLENLSRFSVQAFVEAQVVAHGTIVGARLGSIL